MGNVSLTPVDHDPFASMPSFSLTPVDHDPFADTAAYANSLPSSGPTPDQQAMSHYAPQPGILDDPNVPTAGKVAAIVMDEPRRMAAGMLGMPQDAIRLGNQVQSEIYGSSPASTDQPMQQGVSQHSAGQSLGIAAGLVGGGTPFAQEGALGVGGGRLSPQTWSDAARSYLEEAHDNHAGEFGAAAANEPSQYRVDHGWLAQKIGHLRDQGPDFQPSPGNAPDVYGADPGMADVFSRYRDTAIQRNANPVPQTPQWSPDTVQFLNAERDHLASLGQTDRAAAYNDILAAGPGQFPANLQGNYRAQQAYDTAMDNHAYETQPPAATPVTDAAMPARRAGPFQPPAPRDQTGAAARIAQSLEDPLQQHLDAAGLDRPAFMQQMFGRDGPSAVVDPSYGGKATTLRAPVTDETGNNIGVIVRTFPGDGTVDHTYFRLADGQGAGVAKDMLSRQIPLYQQMGLNSVSVHANIDVGGYAWGKYGFMPDQSSWNVLRRTDGPLQTKLAQVADQLPPAELADTQKLLSMRDPSALWGLADRVSQVTPPSAQEPTTLGKHLLLGSNWQGKLNLSDPVTMARFNDYVGKSVLPR